MRVSDTPRRVYDRSIDPPRISSSQFTLAIEAFNENMPSFLCFLFFFFFFFFLRPESSTLIGRLIKGGEKISQSYLNLYICTYGTCRLWDFFSVTFQLVTKECFELAIRLRTDGFGHILHLFSIIRWHYLCIFIIVMYIYICVQCNFIDLVPVFVSQLKIFS